MERVAAPRPHVPVQRARALRKNMTDAERKLWFALRDRRFANFKFRRQVPIGRYVADFICFDARIVIEVDGGQHAESAADQVRDQWFTANGFRVLRFWNNEVLGNMEGVLTVLIEALTPAAPPPHPAAPPSAAQPPFPTGGEGDGAWGSGVASPRDEG